MPTQLDDRVIGHEGQKSRKKARRKRMVVPRQVTDPPPAHDRFRFRLTIALGVAIPLLSLSASKIAGTLLAHSHYPLAGFSAGIGVAVLAVSLPHLAWAVRDVTGSGPRASWALAVALDCSLVLCELVHVTAPDAGLGAVCWAVMAVVAGFSMVLNCHAFLNHREG